jgi:hypothetical protein
MTNLLQGQTSVQVPMTAIITYQSSNIEERFSFRLEQMKLVSLDYFPNELQVRFFTRS